MGFHGTKGDSFVSRAGRKIVGAITCHVVLVSTMTLQAALVSMKNFMLIIGEFGEMGFVVVTIGRWSGRGRKGVRIARVVGQGLMFCSMQDLFCMVTKMFVIMCMFISKFVQFIGPGAKASFSSSRTSFVNCFINLLFDALILVLHTEFSIEQEVEACTQFIIVEEVISAIERNVLIFIVIDPDPEIVRSLKVSHIVAGAESFIPALR